MSDLIASLDAEAGTLVFAEFSAQTALDLGLELMKRAGGLPVVITVRSASRTHFHAAMPGSAPVNERWALRKCAAALEFEQASYLVGLRHREKGYGIAAHGLDEDEHSDSGGAVPVVVRGVGVVAVAAVSGLDEGADHALVVAAMREILARQGAAH